MRILEDHLVREATTGLRCFWCLAWITMSSCLFPAHAANLTLAWDPSPSTNLTGYLVHYGLSSGRYSHHQLVPTNNCLATIDNLAAGRTYYLMVTARGQQGVESLPSNEASGTTPPNPYAALAGNYNGLFYEAADVRAGCSGFIAVTATGKGAYTGKVLLGNRTHGFSGRLEGSGKATNVISRPHTNALTVELDFKDGALADQVTGRVTDGTWAAALLGDRACFDARTNRAPFAGSYTLIFPGANDAAAGPQGHGFATVTVDSRGQATLLGALADGAKISQKVSLSHGGVWPLYLPLYRGLGGMLGWQTISNRPTTDITGLLSWIRPGQPVSKYWPAGFTNETVALGSAYIIPGRANRVLPHTQYHVTFAGGNFGAELSELITLDDNNKIVAADANELSMTLTLKSGLLVGKVLDPASGRKLSFKGVILQKQEGGAGFLLGTNRSARVAFGL